MPETRPSRTPDARGRARANDSPITAAGAWHALGSDETFKPSRPANPASGRMLWRLNLLGRLRLVDVSHPDAEQDER
jgi:hypothetical protein